MIPILLRILACALIAAGATGWHAGSDALRLGQRVLTEVCVSGPGAPPRVSGEPDRTAVDPETWRVVSLRMPDDRHPGSYYEMELLQPLGWIARNGAAAGRWIDLSLPELQISGMAQVLGIGPCPPIESGYGRVVLGTFTSVSSDVYELKLAGQDEAIGVTYGHPIWSLDRGDWIAAGALRRGERLATAAGAAVVESVTVLPGERRVYNVSVEGDRRYLVGELGLLAHNAHPCVRAQQFRAQNPANPAPNQIRGRGGDSKTLDINLRRAGVQRPEGAAAHHIVAHGDEWAAPARAILARDGIDINEAANGMYLPKHAGFEVDGIPTHSRLHTYKYYNELNRRLSSAPVGGAAQVLADIRRDILNNEFPF